MAEPALEFPAPDIRPIAILEQSEGREARKISEKEEGRILVRLARPPTHSRSESTAVEETLDWKAKDLGLILALPFNT